MSVGRKEGMHVGVERYIYDELLYYLMLKKILGTVLMYSSTLGYDYRSIISKSWISFGSVNLVVHYTFISDASLQTFYEL